LPVIIAYRRFEYMLHCHLQSMAWLGQRLVACTTLEYLLLDVAAGTATPLFSLPAEAPPPTLIHRLPGGVPLALLLMVHFRPTFAPLAASSSPAGQPTREMRTSAMRCYDAVTADEPCHIIVRCSGNCRTKWAS
jgi:hypothetical protein